MERLPALLWKPLHCWMFVELHNRASIYLYMQPTFPAKKGSLLQLCRPSELVRLLQPLAKPGTPGLS